MSRDPLEIGPNGFGYRGVLHLDPAREFRPVAGLVIHLVDYRFDTGLLIEERLTGQIAQPGSSLGDLKFPFPEAEAIERCFSST